MARVRLFRKNGSDYEMRGDGFIRQEGKNFYVVLDWQPDRPYPLKTGDVVGIKIENIIGFEPRKVIL